MIGSSRIYFRTPHGLSPAPFPATDTPLPNESTSRLDFSGELPPLREMRGLFEKAYLEEMAKRADGDIQTACRISGLSRPHVYALLKKHGLKL